MLGCYFSLGGFNPADSSARGHGPRYALIWAQVALSKSFFVGSLPNSWHLQRRRSSAQAFFSSGVTCIPPSFLMWFSRKQKSATHLSSSTDKLAALSCQSVINPIDTAGSLTYGKGDAKHSNGRLFRFLTGSPYRIDKQYSVGLRGCDRQGNQQVKGDETHTDGHSKKAAATLYRAAAAVFPQQKITESVLADPCVFTSFEQFF